MPKPTKRERFLKHAERRTANAVKAIRAVARLAKTASYEYEEREGQAISEAIVKEAGAVHLAFFPPPEAPKPVQEPLFRLPAPEAHGTVAGGAPIDADGF